MTQVDFAALPFTLATLADGYAQGLFTPEQIIVQAQARIARDADNPIWIQCADADFLQAQLRHLENRVSQVGVAGLPLYGVPFAVKDNIDVAGLPTTAACAEFSYLPTQHAYSVACLIAAGAIVLGKTNLDQFATGLNGTRSPYGACRNALNAEYISGGSSSGSAVAVALGQVAFALGTDTAGSGRVPAALNNIVGLKPTPGLVSLRGVLPASQQLDCVSVFANSVEDAHKVLWQMDALDESDAYSRRTRKQVSKPVTNFKIGVPSANNLPAWGEPEFAELYAQAQKRLQALGATLVEIDVTSFLTCGAMLYGSALVAERFLALQSAFANYPEAIHPAVRDAVAPGEEFSGAEVYAAQHRVRELQHKTAQIWQHIDCLMLPTVETTYRIAEVLRDPLATNVRLGRYSTFVNLLDLSALALPAGYTARGLPFGISLIAPALHDDWLAGLGTRFQSSMNLRAGATTPHLKAEKAQGGSARLQNPAAANQMRYVA